MKGSSSLIALMGFLSLAVAAPAVDRRAVVTVTRTAYVKATRPKPTPKPETKPETKPEAIVAAVPNAVFKEQPAPEQKKPEPTTTSKHVPQEAPKPTEAPKPSSNPGSGAGKGNGDSKLLTIQVINKMNVPIQTLASSNVEVKHVEGSSFPQGRGKLAPGASSEMVVPYSWAGRIAVAREDQELTGTKESLIEASFSDWGVFGDVSFVDGFTVPITCSCNGKPFLGCNTDLFNQPKGIKCPKLVGGACVNPARGTKTSKDLNGAAPFFNECLNSAYTWDTDDHASDKDNTCNGYMSCCVGTDCPKWDSFTKTGIDPWTRPFVNVFN